MAGKARVIPVVAIIVAVILIGVFWYVGQRNSIVRLDEDTEAAWGEVDNQLQRRSDLIPNLVATVRGFANQEQEVFGQIADARARLAGAQTVADTAEGYSQLEGALSRLLVIAENYPELRSSENFQALMDELAGTENRIAVARRRYNESVQEFNRKIRTFPASIAANSLRMKARDYFEVSEEDRAVPEVDFGS
jgi:LemA protein